MKEIRDAGLAPSAFYKPKTNSLPSAKETIMQISQGIAMKSQIVICFLPFKAPSNSATKGIIINFMVDWLIVLVTA